MQLLFAPPLLYQAQLALLPMHCCAPVLPPHLLPLIHSTGPQPHQACSPALQLFLQPLLLMKPLQMLTPSAMRALTEHLPVLPPFPRCLILPPPGCSSAAEPRLFDHLQLSAVLTISFETRPLFQHALHSFVSRALLERPDGHFLSPRLMLSNAFRSAKAFVPQPPNAFPIL